MKTYLDQLIADMHYSATQVPQSKIPEGEFDPDYMMELEEMPDQPMSHWFGLNKELFPAPELLNEEETELMATELEELWEAYSFIPDFPEGLPAKLRYELMWKYLDQPCHHWPGGWEYHFEFCEYEPETCPFGHEFCHCKDLVDFDPSGN